jgi:hypothetical protein
MAKFKPVRPGAKGSTAKPRAGWPCVVLVILGIAGLFLFLFLVMKYAG